VNALAFDERHSVLYTAGRDSTVRAWEISQEVCIAQNTEFSTTTTTIIIRKNALF